MKKIDWLNLKYDAESDSYISDRGLELLILWVIILFILKALGLL